MSVCDVGDTFRLWRNSAPPAAPPPIPPLLPERRPLPRIRCVPEQPLDLDEVSDVIECVAQQIMGDRRLTSGEALELAGRLSAFRAELHGVLGPRLHR